MFKRKKTIKFSEFMSGEYKTKEKKARKKQARVVAKSLSAIAIPALTGGTVLPLSMAFAIPAFASTDGTAEVAGSMVESGTHFVSKHTLNIIAHSLDPVVEILCAFAFPVASVIMAGACFLFMFNRADRGFEMIQRAGLGYVLIQMLPFFLNVLKEVGDAM